MQGSKASRTLIKLSSPIPWWQVQFWELISRCGIFHFQFYPINFDSAPVASSIFPVNERCLSVCAIYLQRFENCISEGNWANTGFAWNIGEISGKKVVFNFHQSAVWKEFKWISMSKMSFRCDLKIFLQFFLFLVEHPFPQLANLSECRILSILWLICLGIVECLSQFVFRACSFLNGSKDPWEVLLLCCIFVLCLCCLVLDLQTPFRCLLWHWLNCTAQLVLNLKHSGKQKESVKKQGVFLHFLISKKQKSDWQAFQARMLPPTCCSQEHWSAWRGLLSMLCQPIQQCTLDQLKSTFALEAIFRFQEKKDPQQSNIALLGFFLQKFWENFFNQSADSCFSPSCNLRFSIQKLCIWGDGSDTIECWSVLKVHQNWVMIQCHQHSREHCWLILVAGNHHLDSIPQLFFFFIEQSPPNASAKLICFVF